jgi:hypothetical protein
VTIVGMACIRAPLDRFTGLAPGGTNDSQPS